MTGGEWLAVGVVLGVLLSGLPLIRWAVAKSGVPAEVARKAVHVGMGTVCGAFPWIFSSPAAVWVLAAIATLPLCALRVVPALRMGIGSALHGVKRPSYGEVLFAPAVAAVFHFSGGEKLLYVIPIAILTLADAAGALGGTRWGRRHYGCGEGFKTVEGSLFFLIAAFACVAIPLIWLGEMDAGRAMAIALILATLAMMAEGLSDRGFDNLVLPLGTFFILARLLPLPVDALAGRAVALGLLLGLVLMGARVSSLNGGALLGGALFGYGCAILADWRFALPPVAMFLYHLAVNRRHGLSATFNHRLDAVLSQAIGVLPWVIAVAGGKCGKEMALAGVSFAMMVQAAILDVSTSAWLGRVVRNPLPPMLRGMLIAGLPGLVWLDAAKGAWPLAVAMLAGGIGILIFQAIRTRCPGHAMGLWMAKGLIALIVSSAAWLYGS